MANTDAPRGLYNPQPLNGGAIEVTQFRNAGEIFQGDLVFIDGSGRVDAVDDTTTDVPVGVAAHYVSSTAGQTVDVYTNLDNTTFEIQCDANNITDDTQVGNFFDLVLTHAGSSTTLLSGMELNDNATAEDHFLLWSMIDRPDNDDALANNKVRVKVRVNAWAPVTALT